MLRPKKGKKLALKLGIQSTKLSIDRQLVKISLKGFSASECDVDNLKIHERDFFFQNLGTFLDFFGISLEFFWNLFLEFF